MRLIVLNKCVKLCDPCFNHSREIPPKPSQAVFLTVFCYNFRLEVDTDVIYGVAVDYVGIGVKIKFGDSRPNGSLDI